MALQLAMEKEGKKGDYWKVTNINTNSMEGRSRVKISLYENSEARLKGAVPIDSKSYTWEKMENPFTFDTVNRAGEDPIKLAYVKIKQLPEWQKAIDI